MFIQRTDYAGSKFSTGLLYNSIRIAAHDQHDCREPIMRPETMAFKLNGGEISGDKKRTEET